MKLALTSLILALLAAPACAGITNFTHIVVIFQENRTPDNLFQGLCQPPFGAPSSCSITNPTSTQYNIQTTGWLNKHSPTGKTNPGTVPLANNYDLGHSHTDFIKMCDFAGSVCKMDGAFYVSCHSPTVCPPNPQFNYVNNSQGILNPYLELATQYDQSGSKLSGPSIHFRGNVRAECARRCKCCLRIGEYEEWQSRRLHCDKRDDG